MHSLEESFNVERKLSYDNLERLKLRDFANVDEIQALFRPKKTINRHDDN